MTDIGRLSSIFVHPAASLFLAVLTILFFYFGLPDVALVVFLLFLLFGTALLWNRCALSRLRIRVDADLVTAFAGDVCGISCHAENRKLLPLIWLKILFCLPENGCIAPESEENRDVMDTDDKQEVPALSARLSWLLWYQEADFRIPVRAVRRGICRFSALTAASGDGFGLGVRKETRPLEPAAEIAVYPEIVPVKTDGLLHRISDLETGHGGFLEDVTLLRFSRSYRTGDPAKYINRRELAGKGRLETNVYETIYPRLLTFAVDLQSFCLIKKEKNDLDGQEYLVLTPEDDAVEQMLSLTASCILQLSEQGISCGLILPAEKPRQEEKAGQTGKSLPGEAGRKSGGGRGMKLLPPGHPGSEVPGLLYAISEIDYRGAETVFPPGGLSGSGMFFGTLCIVAESWERMTFPPELAAKASRTILLVRTPGPRDETCPFPLFGAEDLTGTL